MPSESEMHIRQHRGCPGAIRGPAKNETWGTPDSSRRSGLPREGGVVELNGIEPMTSGLQSPRSPS